MTDIVNHPEHYNLGKFEAFDVILATLGYDETLSYCKGAALKYWLRHKRKGHDVEDIRKQKWYTDKYLDMIDHPEKYNETDTDEKKDIHDILRENVSLDDILTKAQKDDCRVVAYVDSDDQILFINSDGVALYGFYKDRYTRKDILDYFSHETPKEW